MRMGGPEPQQDVCPQPDFFLSRRGTQLVRSGVLPETTAQRPREGGVPDRVTQQTRQSILTLVLPPNLGL